MLVSIEVPRATTIVDGGGGGGGDDGNWAYAVLDPTPPLPSIPLVLAAGWLSSGLRAALLPMREPTAADGGGHLRAAQRSQGWQTRRGGDDPGPDGAKGDGYRCRVRGPG